MSSPSNKKNAASNSKGANSTGGNLGKDINKGSGAGEGTSKQKSGTSSSAKGKHSTISKTSSGIIEYLQLELPRKTLLSLYVEDERGQYVCRAVLQQLPQLSQQIIIRLSCTGGSFPLSGIIIWTSLSTKALHLLLRELHKWAIIKDYSSDDTQTDISLTTAFAKGLQASMRSLDSSPWMPLTPSQIDALVQQQQQLSDPGTTKKIKSPSLPTPEDLERYTQLQWDSVLHFLVGTEGYQEPAPAVIHFLLQTALMQPDPEYISKGGNKDEAPLVITTKGYDFMLQDNYQQVWHFILQYLRSIEAHPKSEELLKNAVLLLICLTFARVGCPYLANASLNKDSRTMVKDLALFGLLYTTKIGKLLVFYPTRLAMQMVGNVSSTSGSSTTVRTGSSSSALWSLSSKALETSLQLPDPAGSSHLAIIVQTNFQLAAYTVSELHVSMVGLFCDVGTIRRLPNVVFMQITRNSVKSAFALGIKARQILRFLEKHTHPKLRSSTLYDSPIPSNVVDQIWLWDRESSRVTFTKVYQHECIMGMDEFIAVQRYAQEKSAHAYSNERTRQLFLDYTYVDRIQAFVRQWRAQTVSRYNNNK